MAVQLSGNFSGTVGGGFFLFCFITTGSRIHEELRKIFVKAVLTPL